MRKLDVISMANRNLWRRKARTILTCLGVVIGTASIVVMISLGIGLKVSMEESMAQWGSLNIIRIYPGMQYDREGNPTGEARRLNDETLAELKGIDGVVAVSPAYEVNGEARLGRKRGHLNVVGMDLEAMEDLEFSVAHGHLPTAEERFTIVAGSEVINNFWDERASRSRGMVYHDMRPERQDPAELLNQRITMTIYNQYNPDNKKNYNFMVVGVLDEKNMDRSWQVFASLDDVKRIRDFMNQGSRGGGTGASPPGMAMVIAKEMRVSASSRRGEDTSDDYNYILVRTEDIAQTKKVSAELRDRGFNAYSMADSLEGIEKTSRTIQAVLGGIGGITLFVAAIGITNTMVMSIYERTREIGIIKVIGASFADVRSIFLTEASLIGFIGGIAGLGLSYLASYIVNTIAAGYLQSGMGMMGGTPGNISVIPVWLAAGALGFAIFIGLASGLYPANRAIKLSPIVAIRNE
ncbi:MAG: ABC transporter permease [Dethiobacteria bacterium]|jgi:putative ABC transport system permease protein